MSDFKKKVLHDGVWILSDNFERNVRIHEFERHKHVDSGIKSTAIHPRAVLLNPGEDSKFLNQANLPPYGFDALPEEYNPSTSAESSFTVGFLQGRSSTPMRKPLSLKSEDNTPDIYAEKENFQYQISQSTKAPIHGNVEGVLSDLFQGNTSVTSKPFCWSTEDVPNIGPKKIEKGIYGSTKSEQLGWALVDEENASALMPITKSCTNLGVKTLAAEPNTFSNDSKDENISGSKFLDQKKFDFTKVLNVAEFVPKNQISVEKTLISAGCKFCFKNGESERFYKSHTIKNRNGKVTCPVLRRLVCDHCGATGPNAHTASYCRVKSRVRRVLAEPSTRFTQYYR